MEMANQRGKNQKLLTIPADVEFIAELDQNLRGIGYSNRSQFVRDAIREKLAREGITIKEEMTLPPARDARPVKYKITRTKTLKSP